MKDCKCTSCKCNELTNEQVVNQMEDQTKPFIQEDYSTDTVLRHFDKSAPDHLYKWHADEEDRFVESLNENDWQFQFDNELHPLVCRKYHFAFEKTLHFQL